MTTSPERLPLHPWHNNPEHMQDFAPSDTRGGFWHYGPNHTADCIIVAVESLHIALITRRDNGLLALPGGFVDKGESGLQAAMREAREETGLCLDKTDAVRTYDGPVADYRATRRAWPHTTAYLFRLSDMPDLKPSDDASDAQWYPLAACDELPMHGSHALLAQRSLYPHPNSGERTQSCPKCSQPFMRP